MTTTQITAALRIHATCNQTGDDCFVPHCEDCGGEGCQDCKNTGRKMCECGGLAIRYVVQVREVYGDGGAIVMRPQREPVCVRCTLVLVGFIDWPTGYEPDPVPMPEDIGVWTAPWPPADPGETKRLAYETNAQVVFGGLR